MAGVSNPRPSAPNLAPQVVLPGRRADRSTPRSDLCPPPERQDSAPFQRLLGDSCPRAEEARGAGLPGFPPWPRPRRELGTP